MNNANEALAKILKHSKQPNNRHKNFKRAVKVDKFTMAMVTGEGQDQILDSIRPEGEDNDQKRKRRDVTNTLTKYVLARPRKYWKRLKRSNAISLSIKASPDDQALVEETIKRSTNKKKILPYCYDTIERLNFTHPNSIIAIDRHDIIQGEANAGIDLIIRTFSSSNIVDISKNHSGQINWVLFRQDIEGMDKTDKKAVYTAYHRDYKLTVIIPGPTVKTITSSQTLADFNEDSDVKFELIEDRNLSRVPVFEIGAYSDEFTNGQTFVSPFDPAEHVLLDLIRDKSLLDVNKIAHVYLKKYRFVKPCKFEDEAGNICDGGYMNGVKKAENICRSCGGSGKQGHATEQDQVDLVMPETMEELFELQKLFAYETLPEFLPTFLDQQVKEAERRVMNAIFNKEIFEEAQVAKTATQTNVEYDEVYDTLEPFAERVAQYAEFIYELTAEYLGRSSEFDVEYSIQKDFKLKTVKELTEELSKMRSSKAPFASIWNVQKAIIEKQHQNKPTEVLRINIENQHRPFADKTESEVVFIVSQRKPEDSQRILYENFNEIMNSIYCEREEAKQPPFYSLTWKQRSDIIDTKIEEYREKVLSIQSIEPFQNDA